MKGWLQLIRIHNVIASSLATLAGCLLAGGISPLAILITALVSAGGYIINDYFDIDIDKINKPWRPLPSGLIKAKTAYVVSLILLFIPPFFALLLGPIAFAIALSVAIMLYYYSKVFKRRGLSGNIIVAFSSAMSIMFGAVAVCEIHPCNLLLPTLASIMTFSLTIAREFIKGVEDYIGDKAGGALTLAVRKGYKFASFTAVIFSLLALTNAVLLYFFGLNLLFLVLTLLGGLIAFLSSLYVYKAKNLEESIKRAERARSLMKLSMVLGIIGLLVGTL